MGTFLLPLMLLYGIGHASGHVLTSSPQACRWLAGHTLSTSQSERKAFREARRQSGVDVPIYLDPPAAIAQVAHIPNAPYLTAIAGRRARCVAVSPTWLRPLGDTLEQQWLVEVAIAGLGHQHTYHLMLHAAEHPPTGLFSGLAKWWGRRTADRAIMASERQATVWMGTDQQYAVTALEQLMHTASFRDQKWLPSLFAQQQAVQSVSG